MQTSASGQWLHGAWTDIIVGCGGFSLPLLLLVAAASAVDSSAVTLMLYGSALLCNQPHYMATIWRAYRDPADRRRHRRVTLFATTLVVGALLATLAWPHFLPLFFAVYLTWSPYHYTGQNYGIAFVLLGRAGFQTEPLERRVFKWSFLATYLAWALSLHAGPRVPTLFKLALDPAWVDPAMVVLWVLAAAGLGFCLMRWAARAEGQARYALVAVFVLCVTQSLWFVLAGALTLLTEPGVEPFLISGGAIAFLHCAQYLWFIAYAEKASPRAGQYRPVAFFAVLVVGGVAIFLAGPWALALAFSYDVLVAVLAFQAAVNIHHFIIDGAIWKLRQPDVHATLVNGDVSASATTSAPFTARAVALAAMLAVALGVWGLDFVRTAGALSDAPVDMQARARRLVPEHTPFVIADTAALVTAEDYSGAEARLRAAIAGGNRTHAVHRALARLLHVSGQPEAALTAYESPMLILNHDAASLMHKAAVAGEVGAFDAAREALVAARRADPFSAAPLVALAAVERARRQPDAAALIEDEIRRRFPSVKSAQ